MANATQKSIDTMLKMEVNEKMFYREFPYIDDAMKRGVKIRIIAQELEEDAKSRKPNPLPKNSLIELRYLPETLIPFCGMHIFDRQEMTMALSAKEPMPSLRTNNPGVVELAETYFEKMWMRARKDSG